MKKIMFTAIAVALLFGPVGTASADTLTGKVKEINTAGNFLTLTTERRDSSTPSDHQIVWDENLADYEKLEKASIGELLIVDADQNALTRNWKVASVGGPLSEAASKLRSDEQLISGQIRDMDTKHNTLFLVSDQRGADGKLIEYSVVWDDSNASVRERLEQHKLGDNISVMAGQNAITRNWKASSIAGPIKSLADGDIQTISGEVKSVNTARNFLMLQTTDPTSGKIVNRKVVWDNDFKDLAKLENTRVGERLSVRADQNMLTRNWKVKSLG